MLLDVLSSSTLTEHFWDSCMLRLREWSHRTCHEPKLHWLMVCCETVGGILFVSNCYDFHISQHSRSAELVFVCTQQWNKNTCCHAKTIGETFPPTPLKHNAHYKNLYTPMIQMFRVFYNAELKSTLKWYHPLLSKPSRILQTTRWAPPSSSTPMRCLWMTSVIFCSMMEASGSFLVIAWDWVSTVAVGWVTTGTAQPCHWNYTLSKQSFGINTVQHRP